MEIILLERIERLGKIGDVVQVKNGYARNFLLPHRKALRSNKESRSYFETQREQLEQQNEVAIKESKSILEKIDGISLTLIRQASETGQLYGSVNSRDIVAALARENCNINRSQVMLNDIIKKLGIHSTRIRLHPEVTAKIQLNVARTKEDATGQIEALSAEQQAEELDKATSDIFEEGVTPTEMAEEIAGQIDLEKDLEKSVDKSKEDTTKVL